MTIYDHSFNQNEWFVIIMNIVGFGAIFFMKKRFSFNISLFLVLFGIFVGFFFDHTISIEPFNFYDVNDNSSFQLIDFMSYTMFGPSSYFFIYFWDRFKIPFKYCFFYILCWSFFGVTLEWFAHELGVYHYRKGYMIFYSFPFYPIVQIMLICLFFKVSQSMKKMT
ncbi:hypothetical protein QFZ87_004284 [Bacillus sp. SLBN-46]|uniref:hypothetical protein n=1 Tax=Bacillus sp. SLBN-46 TaxID=3042283 RepID=UPI00285D966F|nr:hypothetical protein [Bacillus sp. SLBN-46]MDR6124687.1 hypothetical protein [Bacillus sp. SLBN-46]